MNIKEPLPEQTNGGLSCGLRKTEPKAFSKFVGGELSQPRFEAFDSRFCGGGAAAADAVSRVRRSPCGNDGKNIFREHFAVRLIFFQGESPLNGGCF